jgi:hypothetical protein
VAKLVKLLESEKTVIAERWLAKLFDTYPPDMLKLLRKSGEHDQFNNPVGHILADGINGALDGLIESDEDKVRRNLDNILRLRSVQDMSASAAVAFIFFLKDIVRKVLAKGLDGRSVMTELLRFDARIDQATLIAFDVYVECREKVYELRVNDVKRSVSQIMKMSGYFNYDPETKPDHEPGKM